MTSEWAEQKQKKTQRINKTKSIKPSLYKMNKKKKIRREKQEK